MMMMEAALTDNEKAAVQQLQQGLEASKAVSFWLYSMLAQPYSTDQLLLKGTAPTQLSAVVNSSLYDLGFNATGGRGNEVSFTCFLHHTLPGELDAKGIRQSSLIPGVLLVYRKGAVMFQPSCSQ